MPYAHVAVAVEGAGWPNPDNIPLMITNTLIGTWDRSVGSASGMAGQLALDCSRDNLCNSFQVCHMHRQYHYGRLVVPLL